MVVVVVGLSALYICGFSSTYRKCDIFTSRYTIYRNGGLDTRRKLLQLVDRASIETLDAVGMIDSNGILVGYSYLEHNFSHCEFL